jgi:predicted ATPase
VTKGRRADRPPGFDDEITRLLQEPPVMLQLHPMTVYQMAALLQLAARHPQLSDAMYQQAVELLNQFKPIFENYPIIRESISQGWDSTYDA